MKKVIILIAASLFAVSCSNVAAGNAKLLILKSLIKTFVMLKEHCRLGILIESWRQRKNMLIQAMPKRNICMGTLFT